MRIVLVLSGCLGLLLSLGCVSKHAAKGSDASDSVAFNPVPGNVVVAPENTLSGKVVKVNPNGRFVVLSFPPGQMPAVERVFSAYRRGYKVAEVKISGPHLDDNIVADVISGEAEIGDQIREN